MKQKITDAPNFKTMILSCRDCGNDFLLTDSEQRWMWKRNLANPTHCQQCRNLRKQSGDTEKAGAK
jgi:hypothetical protein